MSSKSFLKNICHTKLKKLGTVALPIYNNKTAITILQTTPIILLIQPPCLHNLNLPPKYHICPIKLSNNGEAHHRVHCHNALCNSYPLGLCCKQSNCKHHYLAKSWLSIPSVLHQPRLLPPPPPPVACIERKLYTSHSGGTPPSDGSPL